MGSVVRRSPFLAKRPLTVKQEEIAHDPSRLCASWPGGLECATGIHRGIYKTAWMQEVRQFIKQREGRMVKSAARLLFEKDEALSTMPKASKQRLELFLSTMDVIETLAYASHQPAPYKEDSVTLGTEAVHAGSPG